MLFENLSSTLSMAMIDFSSPLTKMRTSSAKLRCEIAKDLHLGRALKSHSKLKDNILITPTDACQDGDCVLWSASLNGQF